MWAPRLSGTRVEGDDREQARQEEDDQEQQPGERKEGGHGPDVIYDPVGGEVSLQAFRSIAWRGRHLVVGFAWAWGVTWVIFKVAKRFMQIRVAPEVEIAGLDMPEFGAYCYPDHGVRFTVDTWRREDMPYNQFPCDSRDV